MNLEDFTCNHACRNMCSALNEALRAETKLTEFYERMEGECDYPEIHRFIHEIVEQRRESILCIVQKLNEMYARGEALDGIASSFGETAA